jgi:hypothetical protein
MKVQNTTARKDINMTATKKIIALKQKQVAIELELKKAKQEALQELTDVISFIGLEDIDRKTFAGALLTIKHQIDEVKRSGKMTKEVEDWQQAGETFLRKFKRSRTTAKSGSKSKSSAPTPTQATTKKSA